MSEVIKTVLTADSSELAAEFAKASAIARKYAAERESQGNRALATVRAEVEALRLEATGHGTAAAALREKIQLTEQARQLAAKAGLSEENATRILARQLELKKQMVTASAAVAAAEQRAARISAPGRSGVALPEMALTAANLQAMEKYQARAAEIRRGMNRMQGPSSGSAMGLLAVSAAIEDAQYGFKGVINNIPQAVMAFGNFTPAAMRLSAGLSLVAVAGYAAYKAGYALGADQSVLKWAETQTAALAASKEALDRYQDATRQRRDRDASAVRMNEELERGNRIIERGLKLDDDRLQGIEKQRAALERRRAAEDAILSAAAAGGFSGNRVVSAGRNLEDSRAVDDAAAAQKRLTDLGREWERIWKETGRVAGEYAAQRRADSRELEQASNSLDGLKAKQVELNTILKDKDAYGDRDRVKFQNDLESIRKQIAEREKLITNKSGEMQLNETLAKQATETGKASLEQLRKLQEAERQRIAQIPEEIRLREQLRKIEDATHARAASDWQKELAIQQALAGNDVGRVRTLERQRDIEAEKRRIMAEQKGISEAMAGKQATTMVDTRADAGAAAARKAAAGELEILRARAAGDAIRAGALRAAATLESEILAIMQQQNLTREQATQQAKERADLERAQARGDVMAELKALHMEAGGDKKGAKRLREEMRIREEAIGLAQRLGITEAQAQSILREKARLQKEISDREKSSRRGDDERNRLRGRIYTKTRDESQSPRVGLGDRYGLGLRNHEVNRRNTERSNRPAKPADDAAKNLLKSVNIQEEMLKIWQKLNVV